MSNAIACDFGHRSQRYGWPMTPRQLRRADHKIRRMYYPETAPEWSIEGRTETIGRKGTTPRKAHATPRQRKPRRG